MRGDYPNQMAKNWHSDQSRVGPIWLMTAVHRLSRVESKSGLILVSFQEPHRAETGMDANNSISLRREKKKIHLQNFKLALSANEYALYVKHAGSPLGNALALFSRSILFIPFVVMHILSRTRGNQFPCNSSQDAHTYWDTKQDLQTAKFRFVLVEDWLCVMDIQYCLLLKAQMENQRGFIQLNCVLLLYLSRMFPFKIYYIYLIDIFRYFSCFLFFLMNHLTFVQLGSLVVA